MRKITPRMSRMRRMIRPMRRGLLVAQRRAILAVQLSGSTEGTSRSTIHQLNICTYSVEQNLSIVHRQNNIRQARSLRNNSWNMKAFTYGTRQMNRLLDDTLMKTYPFPSQTLMELAGVACAQVANRILKQKRQQTELSPKDQSVTVLVGPGNNGGDGLVAARHLAMMNYPVDIVTFKELQGKNGIYQTLCELNGIPHYHHTHFQDQQQSIAVKFREHLKGRTMIMDGIFGFPFQGEIRQPYRDFINELTPFEDRILSIDVPSGWDANQGNVLKLFTPAYLISLGMPKKCSQNFKGEHYFGGRFIPEKLKKELGIVLPEFEDDALYCRL